MYQQQITEISLKLDTENRITMVYLFKIVVFVIFLCLNSMINFCVLVKSFFFNQR